MALKDKDYPSSYLSGAMQAGKVVKMGGEWRPGDGRPLRPLTRQPAFGGALGLPGATPFAAPAAPPAPSPPSSPPVAAPKAERQAVAAAASVPDVPSDPPPVPVLKTPVFRCGLWSDGTLEMQRDGVTVAVVHEGEAETVLSFMDRLRPVREIA
jgi:hypothetical protein